MHTDNLSQKKVPLFNVHVKHLTSSSKLKQYISHFDIVQTGTKIKKKQKTEDTKT
jgi:hypothetical protein